MPKYPNDSYLWALLCAEFAEAGVRDGAARERH